MVFWYDIKALLNSFYLIKIKNKVVWVYLSFKFKRFSLKKYVKKLYKLYLKFLPNSLNF
jgi:hypothetical protein